MPESSDGDRADAGHRRRRRPRVDGGLLPSSHRPLARARARRHLSVDPARQPQQPAGARRAPCGRPRPHGQLVRCLRRASRWRGRRAGDRRFRDDASRLRPGRGGGADPDAQHPRRPRRCGARRRHPPTRRNRHPADAEGQFFARPFEAAGIELIRPDEADRGFGHEVYFNELVKGRFSDETRARLVDVVERLKTRHDIDAVILRGTELPLIFREPRYAGVPVLDATGIHVDAAVDRLLGG